MAADSSPSSVPHARIVFQPSGRAGTVPIGISLLEAARSLGVGLESICGGQQTCGKCLVFVESGYFPKHDLTSDPAHLSPPTAQEQRFREQRGLPATARLACAAQVLGDLLITVPPESQAQRQVILKAATERSLELDPAIRLYYVQVAPPQMGNRSDQERVAAELAARFGLSSLGWAYPALSALPVALRAGQGALTATVWQGREIIRVQPGYHEAPLGLAVDIGTTTLAAYLCDLRNGALLATASAMNPQVTCGDDIMSRISYAMEHPQGLAQLQQRVVTAINDLARQATAEIGRAVEDVVDVTLVGNSVMHHLVLGLDPQPLGVLPFVPVAGGPVDLRAAELGLSLNPGARVHVLPLEAGFVGADNVGVLLAEEPHRRDELSLILDVGTNGELVLGNRERLLCTSAATGPAFEGAQITHGMRAAPGAIERVRLDPETLAVRFKVIGQELWSDELPPEALQARGVCGSGILEAVAELLAAGLLEPNGRFSARRETPRLVRYHGKAAFVLAEATQSATGAPIVITQSDVRAIQLAKAALYVGAQFLMREFGVQSVDRIVLAGAFGSVLDAQRAMAIGMLPPCDPRHVFSVGNAAGDGARIALLSCAKRREAAELALRVEHLTPSLEGEFQPAFVAALQFPAHPSLCLGL